MSDCRQATADEMKLVSKQIDTSKLLSRLEADNERLAEENAKLRKALMAAEQSLIIYVGIYGYHDGVNEILRYVSEALEDSQ